MGDFSVVVGIASLAMAHGRHYRVVGGSMVVSI